MKTIKQAMRWWLVMPLLALLVPVCIEVFGMERYVMAVNVASTLSPLTNTTLVSTNSTALEIKPDLALTLWVRCHAAGAGTSNTTVGFNVSPDGTNWTTAYPITVVVAQQGTTNVCNWTVLQRTNLLGVRYLRVDEVITTQTNAVTIDAVTASYDQ